MSGHRRLGTVLILALIAVLLPAAPAMADDFTVDVTADTHDATPGDGSCADSNSACSLRAAIEESNALSGSDDAIDLPSGDYLLVGSNGPLFIGSGGALDINGASARDTTIRQETDADGGLDRVFDVGGAATAAIRRVTIADGRATDSAGFFGGNIRSAGNLTLEQTTITGGRASSGGGISNNGGTLRIVDSTLTDNHAPDGGGDSGAIQNFDPDSGPGPTLQVESSTISGNTAIKAGGIMNWGGAGASGGSVAISDSTITGNTSSGNAWAGGLHMSSSGAATVTRTIVAGNSSAAAAQNCSSDAGGSITSGDNNLEGGTDCGFAEASDLQNSDPLLDGLANNGGETDTHAIAGSSPALDAAGDGCPATDQRGVSRPQGAACDIGSLELEQAATITSTGPLTSIYLGRNLECQVDLQGASQIYPGGGTLGSCTTGLLGVDLAQVSQTAVTGSGAVGDPYTVVTEMSNGSGIALRRTDTYFTGDRFWQSEVTVLNSSGAPLDDVLWHGIDCLVAGNDEGYGFFEAPGAVYCAQNAAGGDIMLGLEPLSAGSNYYAGLYTGAFAPGPTGFGNTCSGDFQDNGVGLSWHISVADDGSETRTFRTTFQPAGTLCAVSDTSPPDATISSAPAASTPSRDATFSFGSSDPSARFECSLDGGTFEACTSPKSYANLSEGAHNFVVRAIDAAGNASSASHSWTIAAEAKRLTLEDLPVPDVGKEANVDVLAGTVLVGIPAGAARVNGQVSASQKGVVFVPLQQARQVPIGSFLDTRKGTVAVQTATGSANKTQKGNFSSGLFQVLQSRKKRAKGLTDLVLKGGRFNNCGARKRGRRAQAALTKRTVRRLRSNASGRFRTRGRFAAATVRGTKWTVTDRCDGTLTKVARGKVAVRDFRKRKTVIVRAGKSYLARAPR